MLHVDYPGTLVVDGVDIDGAGVDAAYAGISVFGTFELRAGTISNHKNIAGSGGAIYLAGDQAIANIKGGIITNNSVAYGNRGAAIHFNAGSLVLGGMPQVGASGTDNGIYIDAGKAFAVDGALGGGSRINIEGSSASAKDCQVGTQTGGGGSAAANAGYITWLTRAYTVAGSEESYKLAVNETAWHVSGAAGDDATADGTDIKPYKNLAAVLNAAPRGAGVNADIIVMSDVDMIQPVTVGDWAQLSFKRWSGTSDEVKIIRAASAVNGSMFVPATGKNLNFENITIDGNGAAYPGTLAPVFIGAGATVIMAGGKITGNKSLNSAGGVHIAGGSFIMDGGEISGNSIGAGANDFGGAVYFYAGAMKVGGTVQIGAEEAKSGIYLGAGADMFVELTGDLGIGSHIYFDGFDLGGHVGQTVLRKSTGSTSQTEAAMLATCGNVWGIKQAAGNSTDYILDYASYYVASAPDLGDGVALGSDSNPGTATRPYASLAKALSMVKAGTTTNIYIMNNITATAVASITFGADKTANISKWEHSPAIGNIVVTRGSAFTGTMIQVYGGVTLSMNGITLDGADVNANGAAIHLGVENNNGSIVLNLANCVLKNNQNYNTNIGYAVGGAICADATALVGKQINLKDTEFTDNYSAAEGGAIFAYRNVVLNVEDTVFERNSALKNGGAISTNLGCSINLKDGAVFAQNTAGAKGAAIYFYTSAVATAIMNVYNGVFVGNNDNDNGIFYVNANGAVLRLLEDFTSGRINIEGIETARGNTAVMSKTGGDGVATGAEASLMHYQANSPPYGIVPNSAATGFVLKGAGAYYVAAPGTVHDGDDSNPGTEAAPFATLQKAIAAVPVGADTPTQIIVMSDLELSAPAALAAGQRNLSIEGYKGDAGKPNGDYTIRRAASYKGAMLTTAYVANQSTAATLKDLLWDGNKGAVDATSPIVDIQQGGTITLGSGALTNNRNMTGSAAGAVMLGEYATFNTTGGVISLNEGDYGGALQQM
ncbi:MAG: hypothetical protein LBS91_07275, partial [Clostridiales Family XIII bacterium]|nr:hypothetical protein [Clostridiales Family XIII bacterium]